MMSAGSRGLLVKSRSSASFLGSKRKPSIRSPLERNDHASRRSVKARPWASIGRPRKPHGERGPAPLDERTARRGPSDGNGNERRPLREERLARTGAFVPNSLAWMSPIRGNGRGEGKSQGMTPRLTRSRVQTAMDTNGARRILEMAGWTGIEPATSGVTGRRSNQAELPPLEANEAPGAQNKGRRVSRGVPRSGCGRRNRSRTCDLRLVRPTLSQLSYPPLVDSVLEQFAGAEAGVTRGGDIDLRARLGVTPRARLAA